MADIRVFFPEVGPPQVDLPLAAELKGRRVNWHVHSHNRAVKRVRIRFEAYERPPTGFPRDFFGDHGLNAVFNEYTKEMGVFIPNVGASAVIWGEAPTMGEQNYRPYERRDKYTISGLDQNGNVLAGVELDPEIITDDPP